jgi:hypothetical protein
VGNWLSWHGGYSTKLSATAELYYRAADRKPFSTLHIKQIMLNRRRRPRLVRGMAIRESAKARYVKFGKLSALNKAGELIFYI